MGSLNGAGREIRTPDLRFTKPLLYQLSYTGNYGPGPPKGAYMATGGVTGRGF